MLSPMRAARTGIVVAAFAAGMLAGALAKPNKRPPRQFLNTGGQKPPGYTHVVTAAPGRMIFISGRGGSGADFASQATGTFEELKRCLELAGASFKDVVKINYFMKDLSHTDEIRRIRAQYLDMEHPPAATMVQAGLMEGMWLEVEAVAIVPE
jgi:enamine deaminase RidA (YjgF/YER057c/UK114 family)